GNLWVTDFGLAQVQSDSRLTQTGDLVGTLRYLSPEQALGGRVAVDHRADVYALGATLYELLTLRPAFDSDERQELLRRIAFEELWAFADFNHDGLGDQATLTYYSSLDDLVSVSLRNADGTYQPAQTYAAGPGPFSLAAGDFNGDGRTDLIVVNSIYGNPSTL